MQLWLYETKIHTAYIYEGSVANSLGVGRTCHRSNQ